VQDQLNRNRTVIAAGNVGAAKRALAIAIDYAKKRESFGAPLADRQVIQFRLAEMATEIEMSRALAYKAAWKIDQGQDARVEAAMAKAYCPKIACDVMDRTIQILGGVGVLRENRLPEAYFISRMSQIAEGSVEMMKMTIAKSLLGAWG
jgi:acyl-CoA dehydrogenase